MEHLNIYTQEEINQLFPDDNFINITDHRDIKEMKRREKAMTCNPYRNELYSINPSFNGNYTDPGRLTKDGRKQPGYYMGFIH